ncbi:MAG: nicotinate-nucleotide--dimethylbenzimidazole phosphoribosyltransferase [Acidimicrobiales bacterium]
MITDRGGLTLDAEAMFAARQRWQTRAKPPGALGTLEDLACKLAGITGRCPPLPPTRPVVVLFAGDHGVVAEGASAWPQEITAAMVATIASGGAAINAFAKVIGADVWVVDVGVASSGPAAVSASGGESESCLGVVNRRVQAGTGNIAREPAMTRSDASEAVEVGRALAAEAIDAGADCLVGGEMGIGNTTPSAALIATCADRSAEHVTGPGAGTPADGLDHKRRLVDAAVARAAGIEDPIDLLAAIGGFEIAALGGFYTAAATRRVPFIVDGVIAAAALCVADRMCPGTATMAIAGHRSSEPAATVALEHLGLEPILDLDLRLGEGTGAALAVPLVQAAATALADMADLPEG